MSDENCGICINCHEEAMVEHIREAENCVKSAKSGSCDHNEAVRHAANAIAHSLISKVHLDAIKLAIDASFALDEDDEDEQ